MNIYGRKTSLTFIAVAVLSMILSGCAPAATPAPTQDVAMIQTQAAQTVVADLTLNAQAPTQAPPPTEVPTQAPPTQAPPPGPPPDPNIPVAVVPTAAPGEPSAVANYNTTINSGPGNNYVVYATMLGGAAAKVVGKSEDSLWWAISVPVAPNGTGWVDAGWVTVSGADNVSALPTPPVPPTTEMVPPGAGEPQATALVNLYVRSGPATNYPAYGIAPTGSTGRVIGKSEDGQWWVVRINPENVGAGYGWVMAQYTQVQNVEGVLTIKTPQTSVQEVPPAPPAGTPTATAVEYVNIRSGPGANYPVLVVAPPGASGEVSGKSDDGYWWQVKISSQYAADGLGWVSADYVIAQNTESVPVVQAPSAPPVVEATPPPSSTGCSVLSQSPADGTTIGLGAPFNTTWVLQNNGSAKWDENEYDIRFAGAVNNVYMHTGPDVYDLATTVASGSTYNLTIPMLAPFGPGTFGELWQIVKGNESVCDFYVYIQVQ